MNGVKVYKHMKELKLTQPRRLKKQHKKRLDVSCPIQSNVRREGDLTYVHDRQRLNYPFAIVDTYDREPVGDYYGLRCRTDEAVYSLEEAVKKRFGSLEVYRNGFRVTLRVDQGSQYISNEFKRRAKELGVRLEYCGINCPNDKPYTDAFLGWIEYKDWHITRRIHQGLGWATILKTLRDSLLAEHFWSNYMGA